MLAVERKGETDYQLRVRTNKLKLLFLTFGLQLAITAAAWTVDDAFDKKAMSLFLQNIIFALFILIPFLAYMYFFYDIFPRRSSAILRMVILCAISLLLAWIGMVAGTAIWFCGGMFLAGLRGR